MQTCIPQNCALQVFLESDSVVYLAARLSLSQIYYPPAAVCNYACTCMPAHTGLLTSSFASSLSLSLFCGAGGLGGLS